MQNRHRAPMSNALCCKYHAPNSKKNTLKKCIVNLRPFASCDPKSPLRLIPSITPKKSKHIIELENPNTDDCQPSNTLLQLKALLILHERFARGLSAKAILSIICINDAAVPIAEPIVSIAQLVIDLFLVISLF